MSFQDRGNVVAPEFADLLMAGQDYTHE